MNPVIHIFGNPAAEWLLIQPVDERELEGIGQETTLIREMNGGQDFCLAALVVNDWNKDLSPWPAPPVFGKEGFGDGAEDMLGFSLREVIVHAEGLNENSSSAATPWPASSLSGPAVRRTDSAGSRRLRRRCGSRALPITCGSIRCGRKRFI